MSTARSPATLEASADGRVQRSARSRARIAEALLELVQEGEPRPTGEQVAARAGVGLRTVFRHFEDMESLHAEVHRRVEALIRPLVETPPSGHTLEERLQGLLQQRAAAFERMAPFKRAGEIERWHSPFLQRRHTDMVRGLRANLRRALPEIDTAPAPLRQAVELLLSYEAWQRLRHDQGLGKERAQEVLRDSVLALLAR